MGILNYRALVFILLSSLAANCVAAETNRVQISSSLDPNAITITEVDIIFLYKQSLVDEFPTTKTSWYSMRRTLTQRWGEDMDIVSVFIPQGFDSETASLPARRKDAIKVFIIAQHDDPTATPNDVTNIENVGVVIDDFGIIISATE